MMKKLAALLALALIAATPVDHPGQTEISVSGSSSISLMPDTATINANVDTTAPRSSDAVSENNTRYDAIVASLTKQGVKRDSITLSSYTINYNPRPNDGTHPVGQVYGYTVSRAFAVKAPTMGSAGSLIDAMTAAGVTNVNGVTFGVADPHPAQAKATAMAVADAREKAQILAAAAGLHIVGIEQIAQDTAGVRPVFRAMSAMAVPAAAPTTFDSGNVNVDANVTIVFLAQP